MNVNGTTRWLLLALIILLFTGGATAQGKLDLYGYFSTRYEKTYSITGPNGTIEEGSPADWAYPSFNLMMQYLPADRFKVFFNLNGANASTIDVRNFWGEYSFDRAFALRVGKMYRKFGLYNEILDAVPTYYGIEPPELFDADHLMISRTTTFMALGSLDLGNGSLNYSACTDNGEGDPANDPVDGVYPIGYDLNYNFGNGDYTIGVSGYTSNGTALPNVGLGDGSPKSGVLPWMDGDKFSVFGGYGEAKIDNLTLQAEYWSSPHSADRNPDAIDELLAGTHVNANQLSRFLIDPSGSTSDPANVRVHTDFTISTWYLRAGYSFETSFGELAPYVQWDYYKNEETIAKKKYGGDNEAGIADDGVFNKSTIGLIFRPIPEVAVKFDQSYHFYKFNGENVKYPEVRLDMSFIYGR
jgi:hypothetical protein